MTGKTLTFCSEVTAGDSGDSDLRARSLSTTSGAESRSSGVTRVISRTNRLTSGAVLELGADLADSGDSSRRLNCSVEEGKSLSKD